MSLNTQAFAPSAPKSGKAVEGRAQDGNGQQSAKETAAEFQALVDGMKNGDAARADAKDRTEDATGQAGNGERAAPGETGEQTAEADAKAETGTGSAKKAGFISYSTSNLTDALRQVSQKILAGSDSGSENGQEGGAANSEGDASLQASAQANAGLALNTVLAIRQGQGQQAPVHKLQGQVHQQQPMTAADLARSGMAIEAEDGGQKGASSLFAQFGVEPEQVKDGMTGKAAGRSLLPEEAAGTVKVLRQETHFAPNMRLSPVQQVGEQIVSALKEIPISSGAHQPGLTTRAEGPVLKTLDIQLTPHELGTVKVSLRIVGDSVEVTMVTSKAQTAELLKHDRQLLDQMLRATGFKADAITVQAADDRISVQAGNSANNTNSAAGQNGSGGNGPGDGQLQNFNGGSGQSNNRSGRNGGEDAFSAGDASKGTGHEKASDISLSDGIYL